MNNYPIVSIVIPAYNIENYITKTLDSLRDQQFGNYEVIVVNDGSTDNTASVVKKYIVDNRFKMIEIKNQGVSVARNSGILKANGKFICFLDGDDWWEPDFLAVMISKIKENENDVCFCDCVIDKNSKNYRVIKYRYAENSILLSYLKSVPPLQIGAMLFYREFLLKNNILFTPGCTLAEDVEFIIKTFTLGNISSVSKTLVHWVRREDSATITNLKFYDIQDAFMRSAKFIQSNTKSPLLVKRCIIELRFRRLPTEFARLVFNGRLHRNPKATQIFKTTLFKKVVKSFKVKLDRRTIQFFMYMLGFYFPQPVNFMLDMYHELQRRYM